MSATDAYKSSKILTAEPVRITSMLLAGALAAMRKARLNFEEGDREVFVDELKRACLIIGELRSSLDFEQGGEIATNLASHRLAVSHTSVVSTPSQGRRGRASHRSRPRCLG